MSEKKVFAFALAILLICLLSFTAFVDSIHILNQHINTAASNPYTDTNTRLKHRLSHSLYHTDNSSVQTAFKGFGTNKFQKNSIETIDLYNHLQTDINQWNTVSNDMDKYGNKSFKHDKAFLGTIENTNFEVIGVGLFLTLLICMFLRKAGIIMTNKYRTIYCKIGANEKTDLTL